MRTDAKSVLHVLFSKGKRDKMWMCCGGFVTKSDALGRVVEEKQHGCETMFVKVTIKRPTLNR